MDKGKSQVEKDKFGENYYNRGVYNSVLIAEAIRNAQKLTGKKVVVGEDVRRGLETPEYHRGALEGTRLPELCGADHRVCLQPTTTATAPPICSSGTAPSG